MAIPNQISQVANKRNEVKDILLDLTYDRVDTYIDNNITSLASAREYLKKLSKVVLSMRPK